MRPYGATRSERPSVPAQVPATVPTGVIAASMAERRANDGLVLAAIREAEGLTAGGIVEVTACRRSTVYRSLNRLEAEGSIHRDSGGLYRAGRLQRPPAPPAASGPASVPHSGSTAIVPAMRMEVSERGRFLVPARPPTHCPPEHLPGGVELDQMLMH
jgi:hypothetical protein